MATLEKQLQSSTLNAQCKADLRNHAQEVEANSKSLPKLPTTMADSALPSATVMPTDNSLKRETVGPHTWVDEDRRARYVSQKQAKEDLMASLSSSGVNPSGSYFKACSHRYVGDQGKQRDPFQDSRSRGELSGKDMDFVHRYAEAATKSTIARPPPADDASIAATDAYKAAFRNYKGRDPTAKELEEVGRLSFAFDENGQVGVIQKGHTCYPHTHISSCKTRTTRCPNQVYKAEVPAVRAARSEFPGPIPTWTTTKRTTAVATNGTYQADHQPPASFKRAAVDSVVGSR